MKLLQVNVVYNNGSTGKIVKDVHQSALGHGIDAYACYGRLKRVKEDRVYKFCYEFEAALQKIWNKTGGLMYGGSPFSTWRLIRRIKKERPDIVHLHCINGYCVNIYKLLKFLAKKKIKTVVTHHAEFFYTGNCGHALDCMRFMNDCACGKCPCPKQSTGACFSDRSAAAWENMRKGFAAFDRDKLIFTAVSGWVKERSQKSRVVEGFECRVVENGLDTNIFHPTPMTDTGCNKFPKNGRKTVLHVSASFSDTPDTFKGGDKVLEIARRMPGVNFIIVASYIDINGEIPENVTVWGRAASQSELAELYTAADLTLIASKRETFSMIVAESLCCGTPIVGFKAGGPETIAIPEYSSFVEYGNIEAMEKVLRQMLSESYDREEIAKAAQSRYSKEKMVEGYMDVYKELMS